MKNPLRRLTRLVALLDTQRDVLAGRVNEPTPPAWCEQRGWSEFLLGLDDEQVRRAEAGGVAELVLERTNAPATLQALASEVRAACELPAPQSSTGATLRRASPRKADQIAALAALAPAGATRVVDFGAGRGHLTRRLAAELGVPALGLERSEAAVRTARSIDPDPRVRFEPREVGPDLEVRGDDLLVGLHACGDLGDALIRRAAATGAAVLLVPCCPQKIRGEQRRPLSSAGIPIPRALLGLANLPGATEAGVTVEDAATRRRARYALRLLLGAAGVVVSPGQEARGINRRHFRDGLEAVAGRAFAARGMPAPSAASVEEADQRSRRDHPRIRRLGLPRTMLARPLELTIVMDRAAALTEAEGPAPEVLEVFPRSVSPRNVLVRRAFQGE